MTRGIWVAGVIIVVGTVATLGGLWAASGAQAPIRPAGVSPPEIAERFGVDNLRIVSTAAGHLLDFRYRIVDAEKAARVQGRNKKPYLIAEKSGARMGVPSTPKAGPLWNSGAAKEGRTYFALFSNRGGVVKRGDRVSVVIDEFVAANLVVE